MKLKTTIKSLAAVVALSSASLSFAADIDMNADVNDLAIQGYDTVSYFTAGQPTQGKAEYTATYKNAIYHFSSASNRDLFRANPAKYAPQYGGYCAMGVALEKKLDTDPTAWRIVDNKLYLNLNHAVQKKWLTDVPGNIHTAEVNWPEIRNKTVAEVNAD
ncbi:YHS domain-containing (seleno)protein [Motiliproteus sediminis]|uniref:YHS domain-containing (seleno)protein n=1 Tax=Motiliproteus sediminis TaxID=1468178 RepID=UPI001AEFF780|nr:YHS domain-containing (seleno)protein [Motiliproteus sediminis]